MKFFIQFVCYAAIFNLYVMIVMAMFVAERRSNRAVRKPRSSAGLISKQHRPALCTTCNLYIVGTTWLTCLQMGGLDGNWVAILAL